MQKMTNRLEPKKQSAYHAYVMRLWREESGEWRVALQHVQSRNNYGFKNLAEAFAFVDSTCDKGDIR